MPQIYETWLVAGAVPTRANESVQDDPVRSARKTEVHQEGDRLGILEGIGQGRRRPQGARSIAARRCRGSNSGHPRDRREYSPLYYNDILMMSFSGPSASGNVPQISETWLGTGVVPKCATESVCDDPMRNALKKEAHQEGDRLGIIEGIGMDVDDHT